MFHGLIALLAYAGVVMSQGGRGWPPPHHRGHPPPHHQGGRGPPPGGQGGNWGQPGSSGTSGGMGNRGPGGGRQVNEDQVMSMYANKASDGTVTVKNGGGESACGTISRASSATTASALLSKARSMLTGTAKPVLQGCIAQGRPGRGKRQIGSCSGANRGTCDRGNTRVESIYRQERLNDDYTLIVANGIPDHCYHQGQQRSNPNGACEQFSAMVVPSKSKARRSSKPTQFYETPMGPVGIAKSGAFLYNHKSAEQTCNVAAITENPTFDPCDGHADPSCRYHYHKAPVCIAGWNRCELMGYMIDGTPLFGTCTLEINGRRQTMKSCYRAVSGKSGCDASHYEFKSGADCNLDKANGFFFASPGSVNGREKFPTGSYVYFVTPEYPFIMPMFGGRYDRNALCGISP